MSPAQERLQHHSSSCSTRQRRTQPSSKGRWSTLKQSTKSIQISSGSQYEDYSRMTFNIISIWPIFSFYSANMSYLLDLLVSQYGFRIQIHAIVWPAMFICHWSLSPSNLVFPHLDILRFWAEESHKPLNVQRHLELSFLFTMITKINVKDQIHIHTPYLVVNIQTSEIPI